MKHGKEQIKLSKNTIIIIVCVALALVMGAVVFIVGRNHNYRHKVQENGLTASQEEELLDWWENSAEVTNDGNITIQ